MPRWCSPVNHSALSAEEMPWYLLSTSLEDRQGLEFESRTGHFYTESYLHQQHNQVYLCPVSVARPIIPPSRQRRCLIFWYLSWKKGGDSSSNLGRGIFSSKKCQCFFYDDNWKIYNYHYYSKDLKEIDKSHFNE